MQIRALKIEGGFEITPRQFPDDRGLFLESYRGDQLAEAIGHRLDIIQTNVSVSSRGTVRGVHFADVPPSQAKYVTALSGSFIDFAVDIRVGSPTFGLWDSVLLDTVDRRAIYLAEGLGHTICSLEDDSTVMYLCSATYDPVREHGINPLDPKLGLAIPEDLTPVLSSKDAAAPPERGRSQGTAPPVRPVSHLLRAALQPSPEAAKFWTVMEKPNLPSRSRPRTTQPHLICLCVAMSSRLGCRR